MRVSQVLRDLPQTVHTLAGAEEGRSLLVNDVLVDTVRVRLATRGVTEGTLVVCLAQTPGSCVVRLRDGGSLRLPREWARCVRVEPVDVPAP